MDHQVIKRLYDLSRISKSGATGSNTNLDFHRIKTHEVRALATSLALDSNLPVKRLCRLHVGGVPQRFHHFIYVTYL